MNIPKQKETYISEIGTQYSKEISTYIDNIKQQFDDLTLTEDNCLHQRLDIIKNYIKNYPNIFMGFLNQNKGIINIRNNNSINKFINSFFIYVEEFLSFEQEVVIGIKGDILYKEALLRLDIDNQYKSEKDINHINFLELCDNAKLTFRLFKIVFKKLLISINNGEIIGEVGINIEVSDIINDDFINTIITYSNRYGVDLKKAGIVLEILENEEKPKTKEFSDKIIKLKKIGFKIGYDDELIRDENNTSNKTAVELITELIELSKKESPHIIKIDKSFIWELSKANKSTNGGIELPFLKRIIQNCNSNGTKIVAEGIEEQYMMDFCINVLGIVYFQGYFFRDIENIRNLPDIITNIQVKKSVRDSTNNAILQKLIID